VFERSIGVLATAPVFGANGTVVSSGQAFDRTGRYRGLLAIEVGGGRRIANVRALLADGRAVASDTEHGTIVGRAEEPPERAIAIDGVEPQAMAVAPDDAELAVMGRSSIALVDPRSLAVRGDIPLGDGSAGPVAMTYLRGGALAYATPCRGTGCAGSGLAVRDAAGTITQVRDGGIESLALAPDAAAIAVGTRVEVIGLPGGAARGTLTVPGEMADGITPGGAIAIAPGGSHVAALTCQELVVWADDRGAWREVYRGTMTRTGDDGCPYPSGLAFSPDGTRLALVTDSLTVLGAGAPRAPVEVAYAPAPPAGFEAGDPGGFGFMPPAGTGLAVAPRVIGEWVGDGHVRVVVRDADEMAGFIDLDAWANAIMTRFEDGLRDEYAPNRLAEDAGLALQYHAAYLDDRGRRALEYTIAYRGGCEQADRHVKWIEQGGALVSIDIESLGIPAGQMSEWVTAWFDAPVSTKAPSDRRVAVVDFRRGGC
jgi:hypothetical protein